jgi:hypothetical protein
LTIVAKVPIVTIYLAVGWFIVALLRALGNRIVDRVASWILPDGQPVTFRLAHLMTAVASFLAPSISKSLVASIPFVPRVVFRDFAYGEIAYLTRTDTDWFAPDAARAELDASVESGRPYQDPVRFVFPLLLIALDLRLRNIAATFRYVVAVGVTFCVITFVMLVWSVHGLTRWVSRRPRPDIHRALGESGERGGA